MLDIASGKSGHSSALLNVNLTFQFLECTYTNNPNDQKVRVCCFVIDSYSMYHESI